MKKIFAGLIMMSALLTELNGQAPLVSNICDSGDPIIATIDSLVTIDNVVRFRQATQANKYPLSTTDVYDVPVFADEVYAERISKMTSPIPFTFNTQVKAYINVYAVQKREGTKRIMGLSNIYLPLFEHALERENLPLELKYLAMVESALNPTAVSPMGATGLWQFMYNTGILYNLNVNSYTDDRRDPIKSTDAACQYFKKMYDIYHDWLLVIASYNCGPGNVNKAIIRSGGKSDFWSIAPYLPAETRGYVPAFIAISYVMNYSREHNLIPVPPSITYFETDTLHITQATSFAALSNNLDIPVDVLCFLNPTFKKKVIPQAKGSEYHVLRLPHDKVIAFVQKQSIIEQEAMAELSRTPVIKLSNGRTNYSIAEEEAKYTYVTKTLKKLHTVRKGETIDRVASRYQCSAGEVKGWNKLKSTKLRKGQRLTVYANTQVKVLKTEAEASMATSVQKPAITFTDAAVANNSEKQEMVTLTKKITYKCRKGESVASISKKMNCSVAELKKWNNMRSNTIHPGTNLIVYRTVKAPVDIKFQKTEPAIQNLVSRTESLDTTIMESNNSELAAKEQSEFKVQNKATNDKKNPTYTYYTVQPGDTLWSIAKSKGVTVDQLKKYNNLTSGKQIKKGLRLKVKLIG
ncbi:MAG: LysM peptidoglycan-binding domain-containing protein [Bacteroidetes bacterium]|nr:LysM peptidoglycan-binding domain-containing protein [Bacteroidota bacterium]